MIMGISIGMAMNNASGSWGGIVLLLVGCVLFPYVLRFIDWIEDRFF